MGDAATYVTLSVMGDAATYVTLCFELPAAELQPGWMARSGNVAPEKQIHATSDQCAEELPGGNVADVILYEVPLSFQARGAMARSVSRGSGRDRKRNVLPGLDREGDSRRRAFPVSERGGYSGSGS